MITFSKTDISSLVVSCSDFTRDTFVHTFTTALQKAAIESDAAVVVHIADDSFGAADMAMVMEVCRRHGLRPAGIRTTNHAAIEYATFSGLPIFPEEKNSCEKQERTNKKSDAVHRINTPLILQYDPPSVVHGDVLPGAEVVSDAGDVIVLGNVLRYGQVRAAGHVYVYGAAYGNICAGTLLDTKAHIFVRTFRAQSIQIGTVKCDADAFDSNVIATSVHIRIDEDNLFFEPISNK